MNWLQIKDNADQTIDEIYIYGEIGDWWEELDAKTLADRLKQSTQDTVNIRINSGGGSVFTALSFYSLLKSSGKKVIASVDGICASAATFFLCAASEVTMTIGGQIMIHDPLAGVFGQAKDLRKMADILDKVGGSIAMLYKEKTGQDIEDIQQKMNNETWFSAQEAKDYGFVSDILETMQVAACTKDVIAMSSNRLKNIPKPIVNTVKSDKSTKKGVEPMDLATFKADHSAVADQFKNEIQAENKTAIENAVKEERKRIQDIQDVALAGQEDLVKDAIENNLSAGDFAIKAMKASKEKGNQYIENRNNEATPSGHIAATSPKTTEEIKNEALDKAFLEG